MTNEQKRAWLDWAVEVGFLSYHRFSIGKTIYNEWRDDSNETLVDDSESNETLYFYPDLEFAIRGEIDKRGWLLTQQDFADFNSDFTHFKVTYDCHIRRWNAETKKMLRVEVNEAESRLDALMEAFRESVEAEG